MPGYSKSSIQTMWWEEKSDGEQFEKSDGEQFEKIEYSSEQFEKVEYPDELSDGQLSSGKCRMIITNNYWSSY